MDRFGTCVWVCADLAELFGFGRKGENVGGRQEGEGEFIFTLSRLIFSLPFKGLKGDGLTEMDLLGSGKGNAVGGTATGCERPCLSGPGAAKFHPRPTGRGYGRGSCPASARVGIELEEES